VTVERTEGYAPIRDYAAIGDGRTVALVARDGAIDWLCLPDLDSPSVFGAILDAGRGGRFTLEPDVPYEAHRRYLPGTNVLETTFTTRDGAVRVTDALTLPGHELAPYRELVRRVETLSDAVSMRWRVEPRFDYARDRPRVEERAGVPVVARGRDAVAILAWSAGETEPRDGGIGGAFVAGENGPTTFALSMSHEEPLVLPARSHVEKRLEETERWWRTWSDGRTYEGPWRQAVLRSALALKLLVRARSGAIAAAPTTSLPEELGGSRNWDYRYSWPRDAAFALNALLATGCGSEARSFFWWLLHASQLTHPRVGVLYRLDGRTESRETCLELDGYRRSRPVRIGNAAADQEQLDVYGELMGAAAAFADGDGSLDRDHGRRLAEMADFVCDSWHERDSGIWETRDEPRHFTQSKMMCAVALDLAADLAARQLVPDGHVVRWRRERARIEEFVESRCFSERLGSYTRAADGEELDAALLVAVNARYAEPGSPRMRATVDAVRRELGDGPFVRRYSESDGMPGEEGAFLACSFWLVEALALQGRMDEAGELMDALVGAANDVGLYSEEIDPDTGAFLGNFPQGLTHLALVNAAAAIAEAES
jgi:GH15 family glucan-1,4-alpha-glucosidase